MWTQRPNSSSSSLDRRTDGRSDRSPAARGHCRAWKPRGTHGERRPLCAPIRVTGSRLSVMAISRFLFGVLVACHSFGSRWPGGRSRTTQTCSNSAAIQSGHGASLPRICGVGMGSLTRRKFSFFPSKTLRNRVFMRMRPLSTISLCLTPSFADFSPC